MNREDIIRLAIEHTIHGLKFDEDGLIRFSTLVASAEREACAKIADAQVDEFNEGEWTGCAQYLANNIRARGQE